MKIAFVSYYKRESFNLSASDGTRENGNLRFLEILNQLNKEKINCEIYRKQNHENYNLIIFSEVPNLLTLFSIKIRNM